MASSARFLSLTAILWAGFGGLAALYSLLASMAPAADAAMPAVVDLAAVAPGERKTHRVRRKPVFILHRTPAQIAAARAGDTVAMPSPVPDAARVKRAEWLVVSGIPPLGYRLQGQRPGEWAGRYDGWYEAWSGAHYDLSGRVREGWRVAGNLDIPDYYFLTESVLVLE